jgi:cell division protein FtsW (lipid II flippase)
MTKDDLDSLCSWAVLIAFIMSLIGLAPFVCSILHLLGLCHFQFFNNDVMWVYVALSAIAGALSLIALLKFIVLIQNNDNTMDFVKRMILFHHKLKNPSRAKELYEIFCEER